MGQTCRQPIVILDQPAGVFEVLNGLLIGAAPREELCPRAVDADDIARETPAASNAAGKRSRLSLEESRGAARNAMCFKLS